MNMIKKITALILIAMMSSGLVLAKRKVSKSNNSSQDTHSSNITIITTMDEFNNKVLKSDKPAIVKFHTEWCHVCKDMLAVYKRIADNHSNMYNFFEVNAGSANDVSNEFGINAVPTFIIFNNGKEVAVDGGDNGRLSGFYKQSEFMSKVNAAIK